MNHQDGQHSDPAAMVTREFWEERYSSADAIWSGNPNPRLIEQVADLEPGTALDVGSGEGADAIWLAARDWRVTGLDISSVALRRGAQHASTAGSEIADRISWQQTDLLTWSPAADFQFDLVSAQFMHLPREPMKAVHRQLAAAVRPGGTLLIVGHHPSDLETDMGRPRLSEMLYTAAEIAAGLDPGEWRIAVADSPERLAVLPDGQPVTIRDAVLRAIRLA